MRLIVEIVFEARVKSIGEGEKLVIRETRFLRVYFELLNFLAKLSFAEYEGFVQTHMAFFVAAVRSSVFNSLVLSSVL